MYQCNLGVKWIILFILSGTFVLFGQSFTRITVGDFVNSGGNSAGSSWLDYNHDGYPDLFVANGNISSENNALYLNDQNGGFTTVTNTAIVSDGGPSIGGSWGDYDGDGDADLFVANRENAHNFLYENNGDGTFSKVTKGEPVSDAGNSNISSWLDVDNDSDLDLFVLNFNQANFLYLNIGAGVLEKVNNSVLVTDVTASISAAWGDYDDDGDLDLFVANGASQNNILYENDGNGGFSRTDFSGNVSSLGCSWGDYDNDGDLDLFVANFLGANNSLYQNSGAPDYALTAVTSGVVVSDGGSTVGSGWGDFDNDGDLDLVAGNSFGENTFLYRNDGGTFSKITSDAIVSDGGSSFGVSMADANNDGFLDIYVTNINNEDNFYYENDGGSGHWVSLKCEGTIANRSAIGAIVRLKAEINGAQTWLRRDIVAQHGYNSQNSLHLHFGLGNATSIDTIMVEWPSGNRDIILNLDVDQSYTIRENTGVVGLEPPGHFIPEQIQLAVNFPNPFNPSTTIRYFLPETEMVTLAVYDVQGKKVKTLINHIHTAGSYQISWDGKDRGGQLVASGLYFYQLKTPQKILTRKMLLAQ